jgi:uncharacterized BrkB/YihY/UPF0761 family membrane protein
MRLVNRVLAALLSLALIVAGVLLIIEVVAYYVTGHPAIVPWQRAYSWAHQTTWNAGSIRVTCVLLILAGFVLLIAELKRPRVSAWPPIRPRPAWPTLIRPIPVAGSLPPCVRQLPASMASGAPQSR